MRLLTVVLATQAQEKLGPVDMLVNCAGMAISGKFEEVEVDRFKVRAACHRHSDGHFQVMLVRNHLETPSGSQEPLSCSV